MSNNSEVAWELAFYAVVIILMFGGKAGCSTTSEANERAVTTLERDGYTDVEATGFRWFTCGETLIATGFEATSPSGVENVTGAVCCGAVVRGCSIRTD